MSGPSDAIWTLVPLMPTPPLMAILPAPKPPCRSMLPGSPRIQPSNEPAVPARLKAAAWGAAKRPSSCSAWLGAGDFSVPLAISRTIGGRPAPSTMVNTESRTSTVEIHGNAGLGFSLSERFSPACGPEPSGGGSISRLVSPASLVSIRMSAPSSSTRPTLASPRNSENGSRNIVTLRTRASSGRDPHGALASVTPSATSAGSRLRRTESGTRVASSRPVTLRTCSVSLA